VIVNIVFELAPPSSQFLAIGLDLARVTVVGHLAAHLVQIGWVGRQKDTHFEKGINKPIHVPVNDCLNNIQNAIGLTLMQRRRLTKITKDDVAA
jgi:hypothetical protein